MVNFFLKKLEAPPRGALGGGVEFLGEVAGGEHGGGVILRRGERLEVNVDDAARAVGLRLEVVPNGGHVSGRKPGELLRKVLKTRGLRSDELGLLKHILHVARPEVGAALHLGGTRIRKRIRKRIRIGVRVREGFNSSRSICASVHPQKATEYECTVLVASKQTKKKIPNQKVWFVIP